MDDQRRPAEARRGAGCPLPLALCIIGERFGTPPWEIERAPADRVEFYLNVLAAEGEAHEIYDGAPAGEDVIWFDGGG